MRPAADAWVFNLQALHHEDFKRWTAALSEKVMGAPVEEGDPAMTAKLRDAATAAPVTSPELFQQVARGYVSGAQSATAEGWMTKPSRSGSKRSAKVSSPLPESSSSRFCCY